MDLALLPTLKTTLVNARDIQDVWNYFLDHFGQDPDFIALGERTDQPFLEAVFARVGQQIFGKPVQPREVLLTRLAEYGLIHGACQLERGLCNVIYFEDIQTGVLCLLIPGARDTKLVRFSARTMPGLMTPSVN